MSGNIITFISNNVRGIQTSQKRMKLFKYLRSYVTSNRFVFFQETHSSISDEKKWEEESNDKLFFSHSKTNSCEVSISYYEP